jgi:type I restriction enzyme S subunit
LIAPLVELSHVCRMDRQTVSAADAINTGRDFVGMEHVDAETGRIAVESGSRTGDGKGQAFLFDSRHILFGKLRPYLRKIAIPEIEGCSSTELVPLLSDPERLERTYLFHWLRRNQVIDTLMAKSTGARMPRADMSVLLGMGIPLPPLDEQRRVVGLLDRGAEIRGRADAARAKTRAIIPALFLDTFGDPATNPRGWQLMTLGDAISSGPQNGLYKPVTDYGSGVRILRIDSFDDGTILDQKTLKRLRIDQETISRFRLSEGDIVVNRVNSPPQLGKSVLIPRLEEPVVFESNMMRMRVEPSILLPLVLGVMLQLVSVRQTLIKNAKHAINQSSINQGDVTGIMVFAPPVALQSAFAERIQRIDALARHLDAAAIKADAMAAGLSAEVFGSQALPTQRDAA